jgi:hypothetical protein
MTSTRFMWVDVDASGDAIARDQDLSLRVVGDRDEVLVRAGYAAATALGQRPEALDLVIRESHCGGPIVERQWSPVGETWGWRLQRADEIKAWHRREVFEFRRGLFPLDALMLVVPTRREHGAWTVPSLALAGEGSDFDRAFHVENAKRETLRPEVGDLTTAGPLDLLDRCALATILGEAALGRVVGGEPFYWPHEAAPELLAAMASTVDVQTPHTGDEGAPR